MTELDGADRLDPRLRAIATTRTVFSAEAIRLMRGPFDQRRREAFEELEAPGVQITEDNLVFEDGPASGRVPVRIYRGGEVRRAPVVVYCHAGGFALGNLDTDHRQLWSLRGAPVASSCRSTTGWPLSIPIRPRSTMRSRC